MSTSLFVEFNTEISIGQTEEVKSARATSTSGNGWKSATGMPTSEKSLSYKDQKEVGKLNANFKIVQALFIVGIWVADFEVFFHSYEIGVKLANHMPTSILCEHCS